jgi:hypothetical protein
VQVGTTISKGNNITATLLIHASPTLNRCERLNQHVNFLRKFNSCLKDCQEDFVIYQT